MRTKKPAVKKSARRTVKLDELRSKPDEVADAARSDHGVDVVDDRGEIRFHLWIPNKSLDD